MSYIDGIIAPVLAGRKEEFRATAKESARLFLEYGALQVSDGFGDTEVPEGKQTDLWRAVAADKAAGEGIAFGWVVWPSKAVRDEAWGKMMSDARMQPNPDSPFDMKRMIFGGFESLYDDKDLGR
ncbi:uncharacterized protein YbaA (DUF1428 family) [Sphingomonas vulcanisoli]|uniref:Uncharacterized protein YbaA (DUF1428 family) n=1 Tax=Sphingomonas vulcanisoli TaxID=1658060 RepID=A0ABX0TPQ4_9SPHN|nr:uncharacterized protein YbaA (DUF1428 family) [Sphingomonas vulcanisoli]